jgi:hypothetical protein
MKRLMMMLALLSLLAGATSVVPMSLERLTEVSSLVVRGRSVQSWSAWDNDRHLIYTYTRFQVERSLKGHAEASLVVRQIGGSAGGYTQTVAGVRQLSPGEEAVLFLRPSSGTPGTFSITGLMQGAFRVERARDGAAYASNGVADVTAIRGTSLARFKGERWKLHELEQRVVQLAQGTLR